MKLVRESIDDNIDPKAVEIFSYLLKSDYETFTRYLSKTMTNDNLFSKLKYLIENGRKDNDENDEKITISPEYDFPVKDLIATQKEIDLENSLSFALEFPYKFIKYGIDINDAKTQIANALNGVPFSINNLPIIIYEFKGNNYICDGHHRWAYVYCLNPNAMTKVIKLSSNKNLDPVRVLKAIQLSIAVTSNLSELPSSHIKDDKLNILKASNDEYIKTYMKDHITEEFIKLVNKILNKNYNLNQIIDILFKHIKSLQRKGYIKGAPTRKVMPQTDGSIELTTNPEKWKQPLKNGIINFIPQYTKNDKLYIK